MDNAITVTATAELSVPANYAVIFVTARGEDKKCSVATSMAENAAIDLIARISALDGVDIKNSGITVSAVMSDKKTIGYRAARKLSLSFDYSHDLFEKTVDVLSELPVEWNASFTYKGDMSRELIARAVTAAREDAGIIASAAGVKLGKLVKTEYGTAARPALMRASMAHIEPEHIELCETVTCSWEIVL